MVILGGWVFFMSEVPLYPFHGYADADCGLFANYKGTSLIRNSTLLGPHGGPMIRALWSS
jgi:hypothetical protein